MTASQWIVNIIIWTLFGAGLFFGIRKMIRSRRNQKSDTNHES